MGLICVKKCDHYDCLRLLAVFMSFYLHFARKRSRYEIDTRLAKDKHWVMQQTGDQPRFISLMSLDPHFLVG